MTNEVAGDHRATAAMRGALTRLNEQMQWGSIAFGLPEMEDAEPWIALEAMADPAAMDRVIARVAKEDSETPERVLGNYVFGYTLSVPLRAAGYLFASERRVPMLAGNVLLRDTEWLQHGRIMEPRLIVLADDPLAGTGEVEVVDGLGALTDALFAEAARTYEPLLDAFRARRFVAVSNGWGGILDALVQGVMAAGRDGLGMEEAWARWEQALAERELPVRRRPLRFSREIEGEQVEMAVRAGCCLWYTTPDAKQSEYRACTTCYLTTDEERVANMTAMRRRMAAEAAASQ